jgi:hypothetical protein
VHPMSLDTFQLERKSSWCKILGYGKMYTT